MSRPLQIALLAALSFVVLWFIALRPKDSGGGGGGSAAPATPVKAPPANRGKSLPGGLGNAVDKARNAQGQENAAAQRSDKASNSLQNQPSTKLSPTPTAAAPKTAPKAAATAAPPADTTSPGYVLGQSIGSRVAANQSPLVSVPAAAVGLFFGSISQSGSSSGRVAATAPVAATKRTSRATPVRAGKPAPRASSSPAAVDRALARGKVVVLLFWNNRSSDDQAVHGELGQVGSYGGRAFVASAPIRDVSRYGSITSGVEVLQSPTIVVVDRSRRATLLTGYTDHTEIGQAVASALVAR